MLWVFWLNLNPLVSLLPGMFDCWLCWLSLLWWCAGRIFFLYCLVGWLNGRWVFILSSRKGWGLVVAARRAVVCYFCNHWCVMYRLCLVKLENVISVFWPVSLTFDRAASGLGLLSWYIREYPEL